MASKNAWSKSAKPSAPYASVKSEGWEWKILKAYQSAEKAKSNPYARYFCFVSSPMCPGGEYGDVYINEIPGSAEVLAWQASAEVIAKVSAKEAA